MNDPQNDAPKSVLSYTLGKSLGFGRFGAVRLGERKIVGFSSGGGVVITDKEENNHNKDDENLDKPIIKKQKIEEKEKTSDYFVEQVAIKVIRKGSVDSEMLRQFETESKLLSIVNHKNIIKLLETYQDEHFSYIVMEYMDGGDLYEHLASVTRLNQQNGMLLFGQLINGVQYLHSQLICHRDLKPENILLHFNNQNYAQLKITDFGLATTFVDGTQLSEPCGSQFYACPEIISGSKYDPRQADIWSCGVTLYAMLTGKLPFQDDNRNGFFARMAGGIYDLPSYLSEEVKDLITKILVFVPKQRITIEGIKNHQCLINSNYEFD